MLYSNKNYLSLNNKTPFYKYLTILNSILCIKPLFCFLNSNFYIFPHPLHSYYWTELFLNNCNANITTASSVTAKVLESTRCACFCIEWFLWLKQFIDQVSELVFFCGMCYECGNDEKCSAHNP